MIKGQCLCGAVQYQYDGEIEQSILCYCQHCQQAQGSIAGWNSPIDQTQFQFISGQDQLKALYTTNFIGPLFYQAFSFLKLRALS